MRNWKVTHAGIPNDDEKLQDSLCWYVLIQSDGETLEYDICWYILIPNHGEKIQYGVCWYVLIPTDLKGWTKCLFNCYSKSQKLFCVKSILLLFVVFVIHTDIPFSIGYTSICTPTLLGFMPVLNITKLKERLHSALTSMMLMVTVCSDDTSSTLVFACECCSKDRIKMSTIWKWTHLKMLMPIVQLESVGSCKTNDKRFVRKSHCCI